MCRMKKEAPTLVELITFLDNGKMTLEDILNDLAWAKRERLRYIARDQRRREERKKARAEAAASGAPANDSPRSGETD